MAGQGWVLEGMVVMGDQAQERLGAQGEPLRRTRVRVVVEVQAETQVTVAGTVGVAGLAAPGISKSYGSRPCSRHA